MPGARWENSSVLLRLGVCSVSGGTAHLDLLRVVRTYVVRARVSRTPLSHATLVLWTLAFLSSGRRLLSS